jgi:beta-lactamase superfamily II metal-dependent hydrolase
MLPAREGDCLWIRYGNSKKPHQILIDGGRAATAKELKGRFASLPENQKQFELLIITHVDRDHIEGVLGLIEDPNLSLRFKDIWFNGYDHIKDVSLETFGAVQGERLSTALINSKLPWNRKWKGKAVCLAKAGLKSVKLPGGMTLTLLSPDRGKLTELIPVWEKECKKAGLIPGALAKPSETKGLEHFGGINIERLAISPFKPDPGEANGSSIAVLAEYGGKRALLAGDAHVDRLIDSIKALKKTAKRLKLAAFKVAHHASEHNVSRELVELLDCERYLVSTNGSYFQHPTPEAIARLLKYGGKNATVFFNYENKYTKVWKTPAWKAKYGYEVVYPESKQNGSLIVSL